MPFGYNARWSFDASQRRPASEGEGQRGRPATNNDNQQASRNENRITQLRVENASIRNRVQELVRQRERLGQGWRNEQLARKALEAQLIESDKSAQALKDDLEECKNQVLQLQPLQATPDSEISTQYSRLCTELGNWSDRQFYDAEGVFADITTINWRKEFSSLLETYLSGEHLALIELYPKAEGTMVRYMMHRHLHESIIVDSRYHDCICTNFNGNLELISTGMKKLEPKRTEETIDNWRADTRSVLQELPELAKRRRSKDEQTNVYISQIFCALLRLNPEVKWDADACKGLLLFARGFKDTVDRSPKIYVCEYDFQPSDTIASRGIFDNDFDNFDMIDAETDAKVRSRKKLRPDGKGCYGLKLCVIHPALKRVDSKGGRKVTLVKATILAKLFK